MLFRWRLALVVSGLLGMAAGPADAGATFEQVKTRGPAGPSLSEVLGSANAAPEVTTTAKKGGSTFDTLNGNVLQR